MCSANRVCLASPERLCARRPISTAYCYPRAFLEGLSKYHVGALALLRLPRRHKTVRCQLRWFLREDAGQLRLSCDGKCGSHGEPRDRDSRSIEYIRPEHSPGVVAIQNKRPQPPLVQACRRRYSPTQRYI